MRIDSIPGQPRYRITFAAQLRRMGTDMNADGLRVLLSEVGQTYALLAALESSSQSVAEGRQVFQHRGIAQQEQGKPDFPAFNQTI